MKLTKETAIMWVTGRSRPQPEKPHPNIISGRNADWSCAPTGNYEFTYHITKAPNFIHRMFQYIVLGIKYKMEIKP